MQAGIDPPFRARFRSRTFFRPLFADCPCHSSFDSFGALALWGCGGEEAAESEFNQPLLCPELFKPSTKLPRGTEHTRPYRPNTLHLQLSAGNLHEVWRNWGSPPIDFRGADLLSRASHSARTAARKKIAICAGFD